MSRTDHVRKPGSHTALSRLDRMDNRRPALMVFEVDEEPLADWERVLLDSPDCEFDLGDSDLVTLDQLPEFVTTDVSEGAYSDGQGWMPLVSIEQARDIFGGGDFIVDHANVRRTR